MSVPQSYLEFRQAGDRTIVRVTGCDSLNEFNSDAVGEQLGRLADGVVPSRLVLDLGGIKYASSTALAKLLVLNRRLRASGGCLVLSDLCPVVTEILAVTRLDTVFEIESPAGGPGGLLA